MTDREEIATAVLMALCSDGVSIEVAQQALRLALEALEKAEALLAGTCDHKECEQVREKLQKAAN